YQHQADNASSLSSSSIRSIYEDAEGRLWIGTRDGINKFNRKTQTFTRYQHQAGDPHSLNNDNVQLIYEDTEGILWIGTFGGLNKFDRKTETFTHYQYQIDNANSLSNNFVRAIYEDTGGTLWVGTYGGLNKFNRDKEIFTRYQHQADDPTTISNNSVRAIYEDAGGVLWVGTRGGLNKFDRDSHTFTYYREKDGLPNDVIYGILEDDKGMLWVSTNKGVSKFDPQTETFTNYDAGDGLQSNEFNAGAYHQDRSGRMYFGGIKGFNEFYPDSIKDNTSIPPVVITDFLLFNKPVSVGDTTILKHSSNFTEEIILDYTDYIFTFEFTALNYRQSEKNQFSYKLEGLNKEWIETNYKHRRATYTNLAPGEYIFRIKASNDDGYWNEKGTSIKVVILPPPWKTWWAYTLYIIVILGLIFWFIQSQRNKVKQKQRELLQLQSIFDNTTSIMYLKDLEGRYIMVNRCYEEMNNVTKEDVVNKTIYDIHPYQTAKVLEENDRKVLKKNKAIEFEEEIMQEDGLHTFISVRFPLNDSAGKPYAICGISMDITERKRAEEEMRHLRNLLSNIINSMPSAIIGVDRNGKVTQWNNGAEKVTQVKAEQAKGRLAHEVFTQCHLEVNKIKNAIKNRRVEQSLKVEQLLAGGITYCDITIFPLIANGVEGAVIRIDDVTEKVRLEEMMIQSEKMMSVGGLAAGMAHEINNPLAGIIQTMQVIQNRVSTDLPKNLKIAEECGISFDNLKKYHNRRGLIEMLKTVLESAHRAAKIVDNMLSFSRKSESKIIPVDMNELIDKTLDLCANDYDMKKNYEFRDLEIIREYVEDLSLVPCEVSEIQQVILNLLKNGAQAMQTENDQLRLNNGNVKKSGFILRVAHERDRNMMRIEVEDNGPGIDEATRRRIFEPFFTTKAEGSGIGLGLSVSYFIITENHGGEMWVESEVGRGTRFIIRLPL
ncbi:PAS domain S-box protein, partial [bacterium]|nr:PAS domain S-box protein [bacterium]